MKPEPLSLKPLSTTVPLSAARTEAPAGAWMRIPSSCIESLPIGFATLRLYIPIMFPSAGRMNETSFSTDSSADDSRGSYGMKIFWPTSRESSVRPFSSPRALALIPSSYFCDMERRVSPSLTMYKDPSRSGISRMLPIQISMVLLIWFTETMVWTLRPKESAMEMRESPSLILYS